jgi:hypothetical protein
MQAERGVRKKAGADIELNASLSQLEDELACLGCFDICAQVLHNSSNKHLTCQTATVEIATRKKNIAAATPNPTAST